MKKKRLFIICLIVCALLSGCSKQNHVAIKNKKGAVATAINHTTTQKIKQPYTIQSQKVPDILQASNETVSTFHVIHEGIAYVSIKQRYEDEKNPNVYVTKGIYAYHLKSNTVKKIKSYENDHVNVKDFIVYQNHLYEMIMKYKDNQLVFQVLCDGTIINETPATYYNTPKFHIMDHKLQYVLIYESQDKSIIETNEIVAMKNRVIHKTVGNIPKIGNRQQQHYLHLDDANSHSNEGLAYSMNEQDRENIISYDGKRINKYMSDVIPCMIYPMEDGNLIQGSKYNALTKTSLFWHDLKHNNMTYIQDFNGSMNHPTYISANEFLYSTVELTTEIGCFKDGKFTHKPLYELPVSTNSYPVYGRLDGASDVTIIELKHGYQVYFINWQ